MNAADIIDRSEKDFTSRSDLALIGITVNRHTDLAQSWKREVPLRHGISHAVVLRGYLSLLCLGRSNFKAVSNAHKDEFFTAALSVGAAP